MALLAIIFSLILEKFIYSIDRIRRIDWFINFTKFIYSKCEDLKYWNDTLSVLTIILIPVLATAYAQQQIDDFFKLFGFLFSILVLTICIGPKDAQQMAQLFINARDRGDQAGAQSLAQEILGSNPPEDDSTLFRKINQVILIETNERFLAVLFWFVLLGPTGAVLYRLSSGLRSFSLQEQEQIRPDFVNTANLLYFILNWIPARLTALSYATIGSFVDALHQWQNHQSKDTMNPEECDKLLIYTGLGALRIEADTAEFTQSNIHDVLQLTRRSFFVWLTVLAVATLAGWAS